MQAVRAVRRRPTPPAVALFAAGPRLSYLLMPLVHHLLGIARMALHQHGTNFFAFSPVLQLVVFVVAAGIAVAVTRLRKRYLPA